MPFSDHLAFAAKCGFKLDVRRARVGAAKHVRVRPRFEGWSVSGTIRIITPDISRDNLSQLLEIAGRADIRELRKPEPYKGTGIRYQGEYVRKKAGKTAAGASAGAGGKK